MAQASFVQSSFLGGEWSQFMQGRIDRPEYRTAMNRCLNVIPIDTGAAPRRPGTQFCGTTRNGKPGRVVKFDFQQAAPINLEFTDGYIRFWQGAQIMFANDAQVVASVTVDNPAKVNTSTAHGWQNNMQVMFGRLGAACSLLQNRRFSITVTSATQFTIVDAVTGANIDGSTLGVGALPAGTVASRILEVATSYGAGGWLSLRSVQAEQTSILLQGSVPPSALQVTSQALGQNPTFSLNGVTFLDGPYLDPLTNGVQANPNALSGIVALTLSFPVWVSTTAYAKGAFVTAAGVNYVSLQDANVNNAPAGLSPWWATTSAGAAINNGQGFLASDVGRLVRLLSEPGLWNPVSNFIAGNLVTYNPVGATGSTYWVALVNNTNKIPGNDTINWALVPANAITWTWGKITGLTNQIAQNGGPVVGHIGNMTLNGGLAAAFDGVNSKTAVSSALFENFGSNACDANVGQNYTGTPQQISSVTVYPSTDQGFALFGYVIGGNTLLLAPNVTLNLRAKVSAPGSPSDGTLLGTTGLITNTLSPQTIASSDPVTAWNYVWVEIVGQTQAAASPSFYALWCSQAVFTAPAGSGTGNGINVEILGPPLLYTQPIRTWRLGVYSNTTGWPTCGTYSDGRIWLSGVVNNRFDACVSNGLVGSTINFAPTDQNGVVGAGNAISYTLNAPSTNPIFWMEPDLAGIIVGTQAAEWLISAPTTGGISPLNISARRVTTNGCANIEPTKTEHTTAFVQRFNRRLLEYFSDVFSGKFTAPNLAETLKHLTVSGIAEIRYQQELAPIIWLRRNDGRLIGITYKRDTLMTSQGPAYKAGHQHVLGSGRLVESITVGPSVGGTLDTLAMVTNDPATNVRHVEIMTDILDEGVPLSTAWYVDDAASASSTSVVTAVALPPYGGLQLNGLWHLNGKNVDAWLGGLDCGAFTVVNGSITVPYGDGVYGPQNGTANGLFTQAFVNLFAGGMPTAVGFSYTTQGQLVRPNSPQESGARQGPAFGKLRRNHAYAAQVENTVGVSFGTDFTRLMPALFTDAGGNTQLQLNQPFTGIWYSASLTDSDSRDGMLCWQVTRPYPCNMLAMGGMLNTTDV